MNVDRPLHPEKVFTAEVLRKARDLLDDDFTVEEATGWISNGDVLRMVATQVWLAMRALEQPHKPFAIH